MTQFIGVVSQKGGVGKSTISFMLAREYTQAGWNVLIADMDTSQASCNQSNSWRMENEIKPEISVQQFSNTDKAVKVSSPYDLVIFDGAPHATRTTEQIAKIADLLVLPTGLARNDLNVQVLLGHELVKKGVPSQKLVFVLSRVGNSEAEILAAREYISEAGYKVLEGELPEQTGFRTALDQGKSLTEVSFKSLKDKAEKVAQSIIHEFEELASA